MNSFEMIEFKIIYKRFIDDARTIQYDEILMTDIEKIFKTKLKTNLQNIYTNAPMYYSNITQSNEIFNMYLLWFLTIIIIDYSSD